MSLVAPMISQYGFLPQMAQFPRYSCNALPQAKHTSGGTLLFRARSPAAILALRARNAVSSRALMDVSKSAAAATAMASSRMVSKTLRRNTLLTAGMDGSIGLTTTPWPHPPRQLWSAMVISACASERMASSNMLLPLRLHDEEVHIRQPFRGTAMEWLEAENRDIHMSERTNCGMRESVFGLFEAVGSCQLLICWAILGVHSSEIYSCKHF